MTKATDIVRHRYFTDDEVKLLIENNVIPEDNAITCRVTEAAQDVDTDSETTITFDTEDWDTDSMWAIGEPSRVYANRNGLYLIHLYVRFAYHATKLTIREHRIYLNGARQPDTYEYRKHNDGYHRYTWARMQSLSRGDYLEVKLIHNAGTTLSCAVEFGLSRLAK
jgi:hypothetical protein